MTINLNETPNHWWISSSRVDAALQPNAQAALWELWLFLGFLTRSFKFAQLDVFICYWWRDFRFHVCLCLLTFSSCNTLGHRSNFSCDLKAWKKFIHIVHCTNVIKGIKGLVSYKTTAFCIFLWRRMHFTIATRQYLQMLFSVQCSYILWFQSVSILKRVLMTFSRVILTVIGLHLWSFWCWFVAKQVLRPPCWLSSLSQL